MGNRTGRHEPPVARVRTGRDSPGREWKAGRDGSEREWETEPDDPEGEYGMEWDDPEGEAGNGYADSSTYGGGIQRGYGVPAPVPVGGGRRRKGRKVRAARRMGARPAAVRARNAAVTVLLCIVVLVTVGAVAFLFLQISGKNSLYSRADSSELVATLSAMAVELGDSAGEEELAEEDEDWQEGDIRYNGVHYRYNTDILTFLFLGIDEMGEVKPAEDSMSGGQSDAIFLLVLEPHKKEISVIGIPRDTMAEVEVYSREGVYQGKRKVQIALQHAYGDGGKLSCERSMAAVSELFYGLPVHGYCAVNMGAVPLLNDAVGGVSLVALETLDFGNYRIEEGQALHLEGMDAYYYLHNRDITSFNSAGRRLERQKQYLSAYAAAALEAVKADITFPITLYNTLSKYMVTDVTVDEVSYLAPQVSGYRFSSENIHSLVGSTQMGERFEEFLVDEEALYRLILEVFYEEVKQGDSGSAP